MTAPFRPLSVDDLFALELPTTEFVVDEILPLGSSTLLTAREKAGKGLLTIDLCCSVALGEPFLDRAVRPSPAIYMPAEEHITLVRSRIEARLAGRRRDCPLYVLPLNGFTEDRLKLDDPEAMERLYEMLLEYEPGVAVVDTMREVHDLHEDSSDEMGPLLRPFRQMAHETNTALILNHHMNKGGTSRGSTAIRAAFDQEWAFRRPEDRQDAPDEALRGLLTVEGRFGPRQSIGIQLGDGLHWQTQTAVLVGGEAGNQERILTLLRAKGPLDAEDIATGLTVTGSPVSKKTVQNIIARMLRAQPSPIVSEGTGRKNEPRRFQVVDPAFWDAPSAPSSSDGSESGENQSMTDASEGMVPDSQDSNGTGIGNHSAEAMRCAEPGCDEPVPVGRKYLCERCSANAVAGDEAA